MRISLLTLCVLLSCTPDTHEAESDQEIAEVKRIIELERQAFHSKDLELWSSLWIQDERASLISNVAFEPGHPVAVNGFRALKKTMSNYISDPDNIDFDPGISDNWNIHFFDNIALVTFNIRTSSQGYKLTGYQSRVLYKEDDSWKIVFLSVNPDFKHSTPPVPCNY